ncbi:MAG: HAD family hydrolase [Clostridia bacterium]|nr:HAD family hydrolase [Clostridia bacterium]
MNIKAILFDLDGTLLPMDLDVFINEYFKGISEKLVPYGYNPKELINAIMLGTKAMIKNDGELTNEQVFWKSFCSVMGEQCKDDEPIFDDYYKTDFIKTKSVCGYNDLVPFIVKTIKDYGIKMVLATNPIFPAAATERRMKWAGVCPEDFEFYTTYENSRFSKPNIRYYEDIVKQLGVDYEECLMIGNDVSDDMVAKELGINVFLLTDDLINKGNVDISQFPNGNFKDLIEFLKENCFVK